MPVSVLTCVLKACLWQVLENPQWPDSLPFREEDFQRYDPGADKLFYDSPRFVKHIDDAAIAALTK